MLIKLIDFLSKKLDELATVPVSPSKWDQKVKNAMFCVLVTDVFLVVMLVLSYWSSLPKTCLVTKAISAFLSYFVPTTLWVWFFMATAIVFHLTEESESEKKD